MAGNRIKGITVEIGGDTTKLQTVLKGVNTEIRNTQSQLKDVEKLLKLCPGQRYLKFHKKNINDWNKRKAGWQCWKNCQETQTTAILPL